MLVEEDKYRVILAEWLVAHKGLDTITAVSAVALVREAMEAQADSVIAIVRPT